MKRFAVLFFFCTFFLSACSTARWVRSPVLKQKNVIIALEQRQEKGEIVTQKYNHPHKIDLLELEKLLEDLTYVEQVGLLGKEKKIPVFQTIEIDRLASVLANMLTKIDASQRIQFTSLNRGKGLIFSIRRKTEGVIFIESNGHLNMAFNLINFELDPNDANTLPPSFSRVDPLKIKFSDATIIPTAPYTELHQFENGKLAPMWLVADLEKLGKATDNAPFTIIEVVDEAPPETAESEVLSAPAPLSAEQKTDTTVTGTAEKTPVQTTDNALQKDIKDKLKYLKELQDEGLISEKDYNIKKTELLNKID